METKTKEQKTHLLEFIASDFEDNQYLSINNCAVTKAAKRYFNAQDVLTGGNHLTVNGETYWFNCQRTRVNDHKNIFSYKIYSQMKENFVPGYQLLIQNFTPHGYEGI